ncbi:TetR/AcrR family transcriptional regulator [Clostridium beijerinckii]|uniref:TetR/AcrR family transcriptional regulator n=1 Tax=Clostridium beijerinckii TaxID=1520 RepID=UPI0022E95A50|nr:TetR/AcrR family transcriptional regulator [Clostridium beijerinckii]
MPPSTKITKEMILETGYELVITTGIESVNSRSIAKMLGCSTQPIFSQFPSMEELKQGIHDLACKKFEHDVFCQENSDSFIRSSYLKVIDLAKNQKNIFKLIYLSEHCIGENFINTRMNFESNKKIWHEIKLKYQINDNECSDILERISLLVQGIATVIATSNIQYRNEQVIAIVENTLEDIVMGIKERRKKI